MGDFIRNNRDHKTCHIQSAERKKTVSVPYPGKQIFQNKGETKYSQINKDLENFLLLNCLTRNGKRSPSGWKDMTPDVNSDP